MPLADAEPAFGPEHCIFEIWCTPYYPNWRNMMSGLFLDHLLDHLQVALGNKKKRKRVNLIVDCKHTAAYGLPNRVMGYIILLDLYILAHF